MNQPFLRTNVAVIGAGTYGVSLGLELHRRGIPFVQLGEPFKLWFGHTLPGFALRSDIHASGLFSVDGSRSLRHWVRNHLPRAQARRAERRRMPGPLFRRYLRWVLAGLPYEVRRERVTSLVRSGTGFVLRTNEGSSIEAQHVVVATGIRSHRYVPAAVRALGAERVTHSWDARGVARLTGGRLLVVGGGQSAAEACAYLAAHGRVTWIHRSAITLFTEPIGLPRPLYEAARAVAGQLFRLPPALRAALSDTFTKSTVTPELRRPLSRARIRRVRTDVNRVGLHGENGSVRADALAETYDHVVACTGYRCSLRGLGFLDESLRRAIAARADQPLLARSFETSVPSLFMIGALAEPSHGAAQRFMIGCGDTTVRVAAAIGAR